MSTHLTHALAIALCVLPVSCTSPARRVARAEITDLRRYVTALQTTGTLPGFARGDHGDIELHMQVFPVSGPPPYPLCATGTAARRADNAKFRYEFSRKDTFSEWQLVSVWREYADGRREQMVIH